MLKNKKLIFTALLGLQILFNSILRKYPEFVENVYSNGLYPILSKLMRYSFGWIPFSIGDVLYTVVIVYSLRWIIVNWKRIFNDTINWLLDIGTALSIAYFTFHILWAFNYYRQPLYVSLNVAKDYTTEELIDFTRDLINKSNTIHSELSSSDSLKIDLPYSKAEIFDMTQNGYDNLASQYPNWRYNPRSLKKSIYSLPLTYMGFSGYLNPFTNEAQVDGLIPAYKFPTTSCHEIAHQLGYAAENEANFIGCLATINNEDPYFKYSGYTFALTYCLNELYNRDHESYTEQIETVNYGILLNFKEVRQFWKSYENPLEPFFESTFDNFLKVNNQPDGMKSYNYVVGLLINYFKDKAL
jgi:hypothetical protein